MPRWEPSETAKKLQKLVEGTPLDVMSDPTGGMMSPIAAISKSTLIKQLERLTSPFSWEISAKQLARRIPRGLRKGVSEVADLFEDPSKFGKSPEAMKEWNPIGVHTIGRYPSKETIIGLRTPSSISTSAHEFGHELERLLSSTERTRFYTWWDNLPKAERSYFRNPEEMFATAYQNYLGTNRLGNNNFNKFPEFLQHLIKKYHKLAR